MVKITFLNAHVLWALFAIPLMVALHFFLMKYTTRRAVLFANFEALKRVTGSMVLSKNITILIARILVVLFLILSAAGMTFWMSGMSSDFDYAIAIDASSSMLADDFTPNRLAAAKETAIDFIDSVDAEVSIAVVSFSGLSKVESRLTNDKEEAIKAVENVKISSSGGTDIAGAIVTAVNALATEGAKKSRAVILMTDGQHTSGGPLDEGIIYASQKEVAVHTIGIATEKGGAFELTQLLSTVDAASLQRIADNTGGRFFSAGDKAQMESAFTDIRSLSEQNIPYPLAVPFLLIALVILLGEWTLLSTRFKILP